MTTTVTNPYPDVPIPAGAHILADWFEWDNNYRLVEGDARRVEGTNIVLSPCAAQLPDGSIDTEAAFTDQPPHVFIEELRDGAPGRC